jgi:KaiC/GvpD/RAD55 family RecA-like ATPase
MKSPFPQPPTISIIDPTMLSLGPKEDVSDFLAQFSGEPLDARKRLLAEALATAEPVGPAADLKRQLGDIASGRRRAVHFCHGMTSRLTQAMLPGTITIICGSPGASKSFLLQEVLMRLHQAGVRVALLHLEEDRTFHLRRALAQLAGVADLTDETWIAEHAQDALALSDRFAPEIQSFGACITDTPAQGMSYDSMVAWVDARATGGARVIAVDPITLADPGDRRNTWNADRALMAALKAVAVRRECSIVLVSHPSKGATGGFLDSIAGGAAFQRAAQTVLWLEHLAAPMEDALIHAAGLTFRPDASEPVNRILHIAKARNGRGQGVRLGFFFDPKTLRSKELGVIEQSKTRKSRMR